MRSLSPQRRGPGPPPAVSEIADAWSVEGAPRSPRRSAGTAETREAIGELCLTETRINKRWALGYKGTGGLFASEHGAPNNLPAVFWQGKGLAPAVPGRRFRREVAREFGDLRPQPPLPSVAERVGSAPHRTQRAARLDAADERRHC